VDRAAFVAGPGLFEREIEFRAAADDVGFGPIDEGAAELDRAPVAQADGFCHGVGKFVATVGIDRVVPAVCRIGDLFGADGQGVACGDGEQNHVPIWHDRGFHRFLGVVAFGDVDFGGGQAAAREQWLDRSEVGGLVGRINRAANLGGMCELAAMTLAVIDRERVDGVARGAQVVEEDGRVESAGID